MSKSKYGIKLETPLNMYAKYKNAIACSKKTTVFSPKTCEEYAKLAEEYREEVVTVCMEITAWINHAEKGCRARKIEAIDVREACADVEDHLDVTKKALNGCSFEVNLHGQQFPNAYTNKGQPEATWFTVEYRSGNWYLSSVRRGTARASHNVDAYLTDEAKAAIVKQYQAW